MTDKEWLLDLAGRLDNGAGFFEEPGGIHWIQVSDGQVMETAARLRAIAEKIDVVDQATIIINLHLEASIKDEFNPAKLTHVHIERLIDVPAFL